MMTRERMLDTARAAVREVTIQDVKRLMEGAVKPVLLDIRAREEIEPGYLRDAIHIPRGMLELEIEDRLPDKSRPVVVYCAAGVRSLLAAQTLLEMGYRDVASMAGGYDAWAGAQYAVERAADGSEQARALEQDIAQMEHQIEEKRRHLASLKP